MITNDLIMLLSTLHHITIIIIVTVIIFILYIFYRIHVVISYGVLRQLRKTFTGMI